MPNIQWHLGFRGGLELRLREYKDALEITHERELTNKPIRIDSLVVKVKKEIEIKEDIAVIFRKHNIIEYKNPDDSFSIDQYYNLIAYMARYKATAEKGADAVKATEVTGTSIRDAYPEELFKSVRELGGSIERVYPGIYYVSGIINMPTQIIVQHELEGDENAVFRILSHRGTYEDIKLFTDQAHQLTEKKDIENVESVMQVAVAANRKKFEEIIRSDPAVYEALKDLMKDEMDAREREGREEGENHLARLIKKLVESNRITDIARATDDPTYRAQLYAEFQMV